MQNKKKRLLLIERRKRERRKDVESARKRMGVERRMDEQRTGKPRRRGPGKPARPK